MRQSEKTCIISSKGVKSCGCVVIGIAPAADESVVDDKEVSDRIDRSASISRSDGMRFNDVRVVADDILLLGEDTVVDVIDFVAVIG